MDKLCLHYRFALLTNSAFAGSTHLLGVNKTAKEKFPGTTYKKKMLYFCAWIWHPKFVQFTLTK